MSSSVGIEGVAPFDTLRVAGLTLPALVARSPRFADSVSIAPHLRSARTLISVGPQDQVAVIGFSWATLSDGKPFCDSELYFRVFSRQWILAADGASAKLRVMLDYVELPA